MSPMRKRILEHQFGHILPIYSYIRNLQESAEIFTDRSVSRLNFRTNRPRATPPEVNGFIG